MKFLSFTMIQDTVKFAAHLRTPIETFGRPNMIWHAHSPVLKLEPQPLSGPSKNASGPSKSASGPSKRATSGLLATQKCEPCSTECWSHRLWLCFLIMRSMICTAGFMGFDVNCKYDLQCTVSYKAWCLCVVNMERILKPWWAPDSPRLLIWTQVFLVSTYTLDQSPAP